MSVVAQRFVPAAPEYCASYFKPTINRCFSQKSFERPSAEQIIEAFERK
jgi:hypothetical protein